MNTELFCYVGIKSCGCAEAVVVDEPEHREYVKESIDEFWGQGLSIKRMTVDEFKALPFMKCAHQEAAA